MTGKTLLMPHYLGSIKTKKTGRRKGEKGKK
jgi:hypothetical protein